MNQSITTEEWHRWRRGGLGSSDAPIIMGVSPYMTPLQLWKIKTGRDEESKDSNWAQQRGQHLESAARAHYELKYGREMPPTLSQHERFPFLRASLDGYNAEEKIVLEIKCVGKEKHLEAEKGIIPAVYIPQIAHQLLVTGARRVDYYSFDGHRGVVVEYFPDADYLKKLLAAHLEFWKLVETDEAPPTTARDSVLIKDPLLKKKVLEWKRKQTKLSKLEKEESGLRKEIQELVTHPRMRVSNVLLQKIPTKGSIDYSKIEALKNIDLEQYRKPSSERFRMEIVDK